MALSVVAEAVAVAVSVKGRFVTFWWDVAFAAVLDRVFRFSRAGSDFGFAKSGSVLALSVLRSGSGSKRESSSLSLSESSP